jgi:hypothetical protein
VKLNSFSIAKSSHGVDDGPGLNSWAAGLGVRLHGKVLQEI